MCFRLKCSWLPKKKINSRLKTLHECYSLTHSIEAKIIKKIISVTCCANINKYKFLLWSFANLFGDTLEMRRMIECSNVKGEKKNRSIIDENYNRQNGRGKKTKDWKKFKSMEKYW